MEILSTIFDSQARVKIMRLFLFNPAQVYDVAMVVDRTKVGSREVAKEIALLAKVGLIKSQKKKPQGWLLNEVFLHKVPLQNLLANAVLVKEDEIVKRISQIGKVKLVVVAGFFIQKWDSRADILVVGERVKEAQLQTIIKKIEAEIGRELSYAVLETADFQYRMSICDKLVRDIFDYPHKVLLDKLAMQLNFKVFPVAVIYTSPLTTNS